MTPEKVSAIADQYETELRRKFSTLRAKEVDHEKLMNHTNYQDIKEIFQHLMTMPPKMRDYTENNRMPKAFRWLGFMQGVLWVFGAFTLNDFMNHNRPAEQEILVSTELIENGLTVEEWREYDFDGRVYRIDSPQKLFTRVGDITHCVVDAEGVTHCVPAPGQLGCVLRWKVKQ